MLNNEILFAAALQIQELLYVKQVEFTKEIGELHIYIDFRKGAKFKCPKCGMDGLPVHDTIEKTWRHLNFFQYKAFLHYRTPRSDCPEHGAHLVITSEQAIANYGYSIFPKEISFDAYGLLFKYPKDIFRAYGVSIFITLVGTMSGLFIITMTRG